MQVRKVICEWLAWILRMSRPGRSLSRRYLQRKARMRELTAKSPPSMSLISNVKDVDNAIPLNSYRSVISSAPRSWPDSPRVLTCPPPNTTRGTCEIVRNPLRKFSVVLGIADMIRYDALYLVIGGYSNLLSSGISPVIFQLAF